MPQLILSPTRKHFRIGDKNDYCVLDGGRVIGRIFLQPQASEGQPWFWTITAPVIPPSIDKRGYSPVILKGLIFLGLQTLVRELQIRPDVILAIARIMPNAEPAINS